MLLTLIAWIYISFLCYTWGLLFIKYAGKIAGNNKAPVYGFSITCFIGLAAIAVIAQLTSLFTGLSSLLIQLLFFLPALCLFVVFEKHRQPLQILRIAIRGLHPAIAFLLFANLFLTLTISVYSIAHPDTIAYHAQSIKWAEQYRAIPGLANLNYLYGFQNSWFLLCGLFSFSFTGTNALTFINTTVICWLLVFLHQQINRAWQKKNSYDAFLWLLLLIINLWSYTQIRLTATSASPDFIAALYILLTGYLCIHHGNTLKKNEWLIVFICFFAITIKLSAIPLLILAFYLLYPPDRTKTLSFLVLFCLVIIPFILRNIISSGHFLFPVAFPDIIHAGWKYDTNKLAGINKYILAYARVQNNNTATEEVLAMPLVAWLPKWWSNLYLADKLVIAAQFLSVLLLALGYKNITAKNGVSKVCFFTCIAGIIFWWTKAPDPRFGMGFLLLFPALILSGKTFIPKKITLQKNNNVLILLSLFTGLAIMTYTCYRFINYFRPYELIAPEGITIPYKVVYYDEIKTNIPLINHNSSNVIIVPAATTRHFEFRGKTVTEGFKEKK